MTNTRTDAVARLEPELASLVRRLEMTYRRRGYPMERAHYLLLSLLLDGEKSSAELAEALGLDHSTVVRQVAAVEERGYATRVPHPRDGRSMLLRATPEAAAAVAAMRRTRCERLDRLLADWPEAEREQFGTLLARFNAALVRAEREEARATERSARRAA